MTELTCHKNTVSKGLMITMFVMTMFVITMFVLTFYNSFLSGSDTIYLRQLTIFCRLKILTQIPIIKRITKHILEHILADFKQIEDTQGEFLVQCARGSDKKM